MPRRSKPLRVASDAGEIVWVQEEPANMGALFNMLPGLQRIAGARHVLSVKPTSSAGPPQEAPRHMRWNRKRC